MRISILLCIAVCTITGLAATQVSSDIAVGGDVPRAGPVAYDENGMTIEAAVAKAGLDLRLFYKAQASEEQACPIRVILYRGATRKSFDPRLDADTLRAEKVALHDTIELKDFRKHPGKIEDRMKRITQMVALGSSEIGDEIRALATLQHEYALWQKGSDKKATESVDSFVRKEIARLTDEGYGKKIVGLLELRRSALGMAGLGETHPKMKDTVDLIKMFNELQESK
jgi:hypothetical protein